MIMEKLVTNNKKAYHNYFIEDKYEAGIVLEGSEVKALREGKCSLSESICKIINGECFILGMNISPYKYRTIWAPDPARTRKLLLHKKEIIKIENKLVLKGYTLIPLRVYFHKGNAKVEIAVARGKKLYDKRETIKNRDIQKDIDKRLKKGII